MNWQKIFFTGTSTEKTGFFFPSLITCLFVVTTGIFYFVQLKEVVHNPFRNVGDQIIITDLEKPLIINTEILSWSDFKNGKIPEGTAISIVPQGEGAKIGSDLNPVQFAVYNMEKLYLSPKTAGNWIFPSRLLNSGKKITEALGTENLSSRFSIVPYTEIKKASSSFFLKEAFFKNEGMPFVGFIRKFSDGEERVIKPNDTWAFFRPNLNMTPEEILPLAAYSFTDLCDHKSGKWNIKATKNWVAKQYSISYGILINPEEIKILGKGVNSSFVYNGRLPVGKTVILRKNTIGNIVEVTVPLLTNSGKLCFYNSLEPTQSVVIPLSYLHKMTKDDKILLGVKGEIKITFQDILDEAQKIRENKMLSRKGFLYSEDGGTLSSSYLADYVVKTPRMEKVANKIISSASSREDAIEKIMAYSARSLAYISDKKNYTDTPREIPMPPMMALLNKGEDCEGHAIFAASLFISATNPILGDNSKVGLAEIIYIKEKNHGVGHVVPLIPGYGNYGLPFPNHVLINGKPFGYFEATGAGYNSMHQLMPQKIGYLPKKIFIIDSISRKVDIAGFNQFEYLKGGKG